MIEQFVQDLKAHPLALALSESYAAGNIGITVYLTGGPHPAAFSGARIFIVKDILHRKARAGRAYKIASPADYAPRVIFIPYL